MRQKRAILASTRLQFAPQVQPLRAAAHDHMVLQLLAVVPDRWYTPGGLVAAAGKDLPAVPLLNPVQVDVSLARLHNAGQVHRGADDMGRHRYRLTARRRADLESQERESAKRLVAVAESLWPDAGARLDRYADALLACLCTIFSRLGELYAEVITGNGSAAGLIREKVFRSAVARTLRRHTGLDRDAFEQGLVAFFSESTPDVAALKWNLAQSFYLARALGMDDAAHLLSDTLYGHSTLYVDTNLVFQALVPGSRHHQSFRALSAACKSLGIELRVAQITIDELRGMVREQKSLFRRVEDQVPDELVPRVADELFRRYKEHKRLHGDCDLDELFADLDNASTVLADEYGVLVVDDPWFDAARDRRDIQKLVAQVRAQYEAKRGKRKRQAPAYHDALLLLWVQEGGLEGEGKALVVTLDTSLPGMLTHTSRGHGSVAMTLDALLQWISPLSMQRGSDLDDQFAQAFSEAVRHNLLPQERLFDLEDFEVFAALDLSCAELPAEDVERCLEAIEARADDVSLQTAEGREQLAHELHRYLVSPGAKYKADIASLKADIDRLHRERAQEQRAMAELIEKQQAAGGQKRGAVRGRMQELVGQIDALRDQLEALEKARERERAERLRVEEETRLRREGWRRCMWILAAALLGWGLVAWAALHWGDPTASVWDRLVGYPAPYAAVGGLAVVAVRVVVGRDRLRAMGLDAVFRLRGTGREEE